MRRFVYYGAPTDVQGEAQFDDDLARGAITKARIGTNHYTKIHVSA